MTHEEAEIIKLKIQIADARRRQSYLGDEYLSRVNQAEINRLVRELRELEQQQ